MLLDKYEKQRFSEYCLQVITSSTGIIEQMGKLPERIAAQLIAKEKQKIAAFTIVYADITSGETVSISEK